MSIHTRINRVRYLFGKFHMAVLYTDFFYYLNVTPITQDLMCLEICALGEVLWVSAIIQVL
jgi:hypothetical protein